MRIRDIQKSYGEKLVLDGIDFDIKKGARIGLVGNNGAGKTTIADIIFGKIKADKGTIESDLELRIGYLLQSTEYDVSDYYQLVDQHDKEMQKFTSQLGLQKIKEWSEERINHLSGGEKLKLSLSKVWSLDPDILILDEPTNHMDLNGVEWLVEEIKNFQGAILIISHDRYFLDQTVQEIYEINNRKVKTYRGNYSSYQVEKEKIEKAQLQQYQLKEKYKEQIEAQINSLQNWSQKAHNQSTKQEGFKEYFRVKAKKMDKQIKSKRKRLERELEKNKIEKPIQESTVHFYFEQNEKRGKRIVEAINLEKWFGESVLLRNSQFYIKHGEKVGIVGENGSGKTTLIKMLLGEEPITSGQLWRSQSLKIGYLSQDVTDLNLAYTALQFLGLTDRDEISRARTMLANIGLKEESLKKPLESFSLGERTRVKLMKILMNKVDLLILDEPTNHLDLASRESIEKTLNEFTGTLIVVSHDVYFMEKMCDKLLIIENKEVKRIEMKLEEYKNSKPQVSNVKNNGVITEELMIIENQISILLGEISFLNREDERFGILDEKLRELMERKKELKIRDLS